MIGSQFNYSACNNLAETFYRTLLLLLISIQQVKKCRKNSLAYYYDGLAISQLFLSLSVFWGSVEAEEIAFGLRRWRSFGK
jgi:hypothetical protein